MLVLIPLHALESVVPLGMGLKINCLHVGKMLCLSLLCTCQHLSLLLLLVWLLNVVVGEEGRDVEGRVHGVLLCACFSRGCCCGVV